MTFVARIEAKRIPRVLLAELAGSDVYASDVSSWLKGRQVEASKAARMEAALIAVEDLLDAIAPIRIDLTDTENVRASIAALNSEPEPQPSLMDWIQNRREVSPA